MLLCGICGLCIFWERLQSDIDNATKSFKEYVPIYNWKHAKGYSVSEFLGIDIKTLDNGEFHFYQNRLIHKILEAAGMESCNFLPTTNKVEKPLGEYDNGHEVKRDWPKLYASVIGMMLYLVSNKDIYFSVHQCGQFNNNIKASHDIYVKKICWYLQGNKDKCPMSIPSKKIAVGFYVDAYFAGIWGYENLNTLFVIGLGMDLWYLFQTLIYCGYQSYRKISLSLLYIISMWYCLIMLEAYFN